MKKRKNRKASIELSFQFIFSIILIVVVLFVGFYVIKMFLENAEKIKILQSVNDIRDKAIESWQSDGSSQLIRFKLNPLVQYICFANASTCKDSDTFKGFCSLISKYRNTDKNMFFYPFTSVEKYRVLSGQEIYCSEIGEPLKKCLNVSKAICLNKNAGGEFVFRIEKANENSLVEITKIL